MIWIILTVFFGICFIIANAVRRSDDEDLIEGKAGATVACVVLVIAWAVLTGLCSVRAIGAGEVGVVRQFGSIVGQEDEGLAIIAPWRSLDTESIQIQRHTFGNGAEGPITAASSETQDVFVVATINYSVSATNVQSLIRNVGTDWFDRLVPSRVLQYIKQETAKWKTDEIIPNREAIRQAVLTRLQADLGRPEYSITVQDLLIDNISFSPEYLAAIEAKQVAVQNAQEEQNRTVQVQEVANQGVIKAEGQADQLRAVAEGQADANATLNASLTPELLQWQAIQQLGPNVQIALVPSGEGLILDPSTLLAPVPEPS